MGGGTGFLHKGKGAVFTPCCGIALWGFWLPSKIGLAGGKGLVRMLLIPKDVLMSNLMDLQQYHAPFLSFPLISD